MFLIIGTTNGKKNLDYSKTMICDCCGRYGSYQVYMTYTALTLFFIPCFKWNKHYYVRTSCCNAVYELNPKIGECILYEDDVEILPKHLTRLRNRTYGCAYKKYD